MNTCLKCVCGAALAAALLTMTGCHTVEGLGRDVQALGAGVEQGTASLRDDHRRDRDPYYGTPTRGLDPRYDPYRDRH